MTKSTTKLGRDTGTGVKNSVITESAERTQVTDSKDTGLGQKTPAKLKEMLNQGTADTAGDANVVIHEGEAPKRPSKHTINSQMGSTENLTALGKSEEDELVAKMNGIDATLVKMMRKIEMQAHTLVDKYRQVNFHYRNNAAFKRRRDYLNRYYDGIRKTRRADVAKKREEKTLAEKRQRQIDKMAQKDKVIRLPEKRMMHRSPQPVLRRVEKVVQMDREELDMLKYLGTTLEQNEVDEDSQAPSRLRMRGSSI